MTAIHCEAIQLDQATKDRLLEGLDALENLKRSKQSAPSVSQSTTTTSPGILHYTINAFNSSSSLGVRSKEYDTTENFRPDTGMKFVSNVGAEARMDDGLYLNREQENQTSRDQTEPGFITEHAANDKEANYEYQNTSGSMRTRLSTGSSQMSLATWYSSPDSVSTAPSSHVESPSAFKSLPTKIDTPPSMSPISVVYAASPEYPCPDCEAVFRTSGQRKNHHNRKHNLRFTCNFASCDSAFGLRADLERHRRTVHRNVLQPESSRAFKCNNIGCTTPEKVYTRKDNFTRHVERCRKAIARAAE
jgi:uncharacterized C2H2 Zn-finger protein